MIKIYDEGGKGRVKVFFSIIDGRFIETYIGKSFVPTGQGIQFYVDDYVAEQIHKFNLKMDGLEPKLELKEGETLFVPEENDEYKKQKEIEELERKLKELKGDAE